MRAERELRNGLRGAHTTRRTACVTATGETAKRTDAAAWTPGRGGPAPRVGPSRRSNGQPTTEKSRGARRSRRDSHSEGQNAPRNRPRQAQALASKYVTVTVAGTHCASTTPSAGKKSKSRCSWRIIHHARDGFTQKSRTWKGKGPSRTKPCVKASDTEPPSFSRYLYLQRDTHGLVRDEC